MLVAENILLQILSGCYFPVMLHRWIFILIATLITACTDNSVPNGRIRVKNDFRGEKHSTFTVSGGGGSFTLRSGEFAIMPPGTTYLSFSYNGEKGLELYQVQCPEIKGSGITINLIDVHEGRIAGGCYTVGHEKKK